MEKLSTGSFVFRNERAEEREDAKHKENQQKNMQALFAKIQAKFEMKEGKPSILTLLLLIFRMLSLQLLCNFIPVLLLFLDIFYYSDTQCLFMCH